MKSFNGFKHIFCIEMELIYFSKVRNVVSTRGGGVLRFAVIRGRADFQGRLFDPKYFRQGANLGFN